MLPCCWICDWIFTLDSEELKEFVSAHHLTKSLEYSIGRVVEKSLLEEKELAISLKWTEFIKKYIESVNDLETTQLNLLISILLGIFNGKMFQKISKTRKIPEKYGNIESTRKNYHLLTKETLEISMLCFEKFCRNDQNISELLETKIYHRIFKIPFFHLFNNKEIEPQVFHTGFQFLQKLALLPQIKAAREKNMKNKQNENDGLENMEQESKRRRIDFLATTKLKPQKANSFFEFILKLYSSNFVERAESIDGFFFFFSFFFFGLQCFFLNHKN